MLYEQRSRLESIENVINKIDVNTRNEAAILYRQLQSYHDLISLIQPIKPLPMLRGWAASPDFLLEISNHVLQHKPRVIIECSSGASTIALARCCELNGVGQVYSLEHNSAYAAKTRQMLVEQRLDKWATVVDAPLMTHSDLNNMCWYSLNLLSIASKSCQLLVIDGPPNETGAMARYPALPKLEKYLDTSCALFLDDADRPEEKMAIDRWLIEYDSFVLERPFCEKGCAKLSRVH